MGVIDTMTSWLRFSTISSILLVFWASWGSISEPVKMNAPKNIQASRSFKNASPAVPPHRAIINFLKTNRISMVADAASAVSAYYDSYSYLPNPTDMMNEGNVQRITTVLDGNIKQWSFIEAQLLEPNVNLGMVINLSIPLSPFNSFVIVFRHFIRLGLKY